METLIEILILGVFIILSPLIIMLALICIPFIAIVFIVGAIAYFVIIVDWKILLACIAILFIIGGIQDKIEEKRRKKIIMELFSKKL